MGWTPTNTSNPLNNTVSYVPKNTKNDNQPQVYNNNLNNYLKPSNVPSFDDVKKAQDNYVAVKNSINNKNSGGGAKAPINSNIDVSQSSSDGSSYLSELTRLLQEQRQAYERAAEQRYQALLKQYEESYESSRNAINVNNANAKRWLNQTYGGTNSGAGLSNQASLLSNVNNSLYNAKQQLEQNKAYALANKYNENAEALNNYTNNYNNYVLSPATSLAKQSVINDDDTYLKYLQKLGY